MQLIELTTDFPADGWRAGDLVELDELSAAALIKRNDAKAYEPPAEDTEPAEPVTTIDDIVDPGVARNRRVMAATVVGGVDGGPVHVVAATDEEPATAIVDDPDAAVLPDAKPGDTGQTSAPLTTDRTTRGRSTTTRTEQAAPGLNPVGGDSGGNSGGSGQ